MITELSRWRVESGLTQAEAARLLGISQTYFSLIQRGVRPMTDGLRRRLEVVRSEHGTGAVEHGFGQDLEQARALLGTLGPEKLGVVRRLLEIVAES